jgi:hypothetical protein
MKLETTADVHDLLEAYVSGAAETNLNGPAPMG